MSLISIRLARNNKMILKQRQSEKQKMMWKNNRRPIANSTDDNTDSTNEEWTEQASTYADKLTKESCL